MLTVNFFNTFLLRSPQIFQQSGSMKKTGAEGNLASPMWEYLWTP